MTEGVDSLSINVLNANTHDMIKQKIGKIQRQSSLKKQSSVISGGSDRQFFFGCELKREDSTGLAAKATNQKYHPSLRDIDSLPFISMRRAVSYSEASTNHSFDSLGVGKDLAEILMGGATTLTSKHRRLLQAKQAWIKYQISETNSDDGSFKQQRSKAAARKLLAQGGPHDQEFFHCYKIYLSEALAHFN